MSAMKRATRQPRRRRSQAERRDESERLLVEATLRIVAERGVSAVTFAEIGKKARLSRGLATQRFGSKRGLIEAVIAHLHRKREAIMEAQHIDQMPAMDAIALYIDSHIRSLEREHDGLAYFMLLASTVADASEPRALFAASHERVRVWLRGLLARGQAKGEISRDIDADASALMIGSLLLGVSMQRLADPSTDLESIRATTIATLKRAFLPAEKPAARDGATLRGRGAIRRH
ncbi:MAG: TetR family transcriptional regulator [Proteobacteria bacterium]|nr:TetR family transcriptional regulator [Pseudomonadota bacterium]